MNVLRQENARFKSKVEAKDQVKEKQTSENVLGA